MFEVPGSDVKAVHIEEATVRGGETPRYEYHKGESGDNRDSENTVTQEGMASGGSSEDVALGLEQTTAAKAKLWLIILLVHVEVSFSIHSLIYSTVCTSTFCI